jgi:hypothetical protein
VVWCLRPKRTHEVEVGILGVVAGDVPGTRVSAAAPSDHTIALIPGRLATGGARGVPLIPGVDRAPPLRRGCAGRLSDRAEQRGERLDSCRLA